jgi:hypothetical protein
MVLLTLLAPRSAISISVAENPERKISHPRVASAYRMRKSIVGSTGPWRTLTTTAIQPQPEDAR